MYYIRTAEYAHTLLLTNKTIMKQTITRLLCLVCTTIFMGVSAFAQVTTSSLGGKVVDNAGEPVIGAAVVATHEPSGTVYGVVTNEDGRYTIQGMRSGGPYKVEVSCLGYQSVTYTDVTLQLAELYTLDCKMNDDKLMLSEAMVVGQAASKFAIDKTGASTNISTSQIESLPTVSRSITDLTKLSPYGGNGMNLAGSDGRSSNFTVDGANFNNNFGLSENLPGGGSPISIDAIDEVQVVVSPFDVRQTNFIGGGINAITKSGTNTFKGSAYVYHRNENMRGNQVAGQEISGARDADRNTTYGATLGGPIIKNKLFFFANFEYTKTPTVVNRWRASKDGVADAEKYISRTTEEDMQRVADQLMTDFGYDAGSFTNFPADESNMKILARLDWNITNDHHLALRYNYTINNGWNSPNASSSNCTLRTTQSRMSEYSMAFANSMYSMNNIVHSVTADLNSRISNDLSNQLLVTFSSLNDVRGSNSSPFPFVDILAPDDENNPVTPYMSFGYELFTHNNAVKNTVVTVKDDLTYYKGNHKITAGLSYEYQMALNSYMRNGTGYYRYKSLDDFLNYNAPETVAVTYGYGDDLNPAAKVQFHQAGLYAQDEWTATDNFKLTYGIRLDGLFFDNADLMRNKAIYDFDYGGRTIDTGKWPSANIMVSPRVGFNWDVLGNKSLKLRGGTGLFSGRLPLVFFTNMPSNSGMVQNVAAISTDWANSKNTSEYLKDFAGKDKFFVKSSDLIAYLNKLDPAKFPLTISEEDGVLPSQIQAVDPKFKMPQVWKTSLAIDYQFPVNFPFSITGEFIYNKNVNAVVMKNWNIKDNAGWSTLNGADNRHIYPSGQSSMNIAGKDKTYPSYKYSPVDAYVLSNTHKGYGYTANVLLNMTPIENLHLTASYTHTVSKQITGMPGSNAESVFTYLPTVDGPNFAGLQNSEYVTPDRIFASLTYSDKSNNHFSLFYETWRGGYNYSYMYDNDLNGDNYAYDLMYIPRDASEINFSSEQDAERYWAYANNDPYLSKHKGEYAQGYAVYSPWVHRFDFRYAHDFKLRIGKSVNTLQLNVDFKNIANLFNSSWGVSKYMNPDLKSGRILALDYINENAEPVFKTNSKVVPGMDTWIPSRSIGQCWYIQVGIKYMFN